MPGIKNIQTAFILLVAYACDAKFFLYKHCKFLNERTLDNWGKQTLESTACLRGRKPVPISRYTGIYVTDLHFGRQGRDTTCTNSSLFCTRQYSLRNCRYNQSCIPGSLHLQSLILKSFTNVPAYISSFTRQVLTIS